MNRFSSYYGPRLTAGEGAAADIGNRCPPRSVRLVTYMCPLLLAPVEAEVKCSDAGGRGVLVCAHSKADPSRAKLEAGFAAESEAAGAAAAGFGDLPPLSAGALLQKSLVRYNFWPIVRENATHAFEATL